MYHHYHTRRIPAFQPQFPLAISHHHACIPPSAIFRSSPSISQRRSRRLYKPGQGRPGGPQRCAMCTQLSVYEYLKDSFPPSTPLESLRAASTSSACTGLGHSCLLVQRTFRQHTHCRLLHYALLTLLRTIRSPYAMSSTGSLSF